jgi:1-acyl-sn-glycerol-3-phosphate acyltransferase
MNAISSLSKSLGLVTETYQYLQQSHQANASISALKSEWAQRTLDRLRIDLIVKGTPSSQKPLLFVGNHISYVDIPLLMSAAENLSFVAKQELSLWPVFGAAAKRIDTVFVQRENGVSRKNARTAVSEALQASRRIVLFPSGTTCMHESKQWRKGAFEIASENQCKIQPFRISYRPLRAVAYIDNDFFPWHLYRLFRFERIQATIEFHEPVSITHPYNDCLYWHYWSQGLVSELDPTLRPA